MPAGRGAPATILEQTWSEGRCDGPWPEQTMVQLASGGVGGAT